MASEEKMPNWYNYLADHTIKRSGIRKAIRVGYNFIQSGMKKETLSKMNAEVDSCIQSLIGTNELQSVLSGSSETYAAEESTA